MTFILDLTHIGYILRQMMATLFGKLNSAIIGRGKFRISPSQLSQIGEMFCFSRATQ